MFIVTVDFRIKPRHVHAFVSAVVNQAAASRMEEGCRDFVVMQHGAEKSWLHLYEAYDSRQCFDEHCLTTYFRKFSDQVAPWVDEKRVDFWEDLGEQ